MKERERERENHQQSISDDFLSLFLYQIKRRLRLRSLSERILISSDDTRKELFWDVIMYGCDRDELALPQRVGLDADKAVGEGKQGVVLASADVLACVVAGTSLPHQDVARLDQFPVLFLDAQPLSDGISAVLRATSSMLGGPTHRHRHPSSRQHRRRSTHGQPHCQHPNR